VPGEPGVAADLVWALEDWAALGAKPLGSTGRLRGRRPLNSLVKPKTMLFILSVYILFGLVNGCMIGRGLKGWPVSGIALFLAMNMVAAFFAWVLARSSRPKDGGGYKYGLSPGGWGIGLSVAYGVGFIGGVAVA